MEHCILRGHGGEGEASLGGSARSRIALCRAIFEEFIKICVCEQLATIHSGLNCPKAPKDSDLFYVTDKWHDLQPLELGVDCVEAAHQVLQEHIKGLGEAQHGFTVNDE